VICDSGLFRHPVPDVSAGRLCFGEAGLAVVVLSLVEQRLDAVRTVLAGADVTEVAASIGVHRSTVHRWTARYLSEQLAGLVDRSYRPHSSPAQVENAVEVAVAEMRRTHRRWGARRIRPEMLRKAGPWFRGDLVVPSERTIDRILQRQGLLRSRPRKRPKDSFLRWERPAAMQLWQMDIVGGVRLVDPATGVLREAKLVTAVDDHSRFCVIAKVVERATARAVCLALAEALARARHLTAHGGRRASGTDRRYHNGGRRRRPWRNISGASRTRPTEPLLALRLVRRSRRGATYCPASEIR
jgi:transposase